MMLELQHWLHHKLREGFEVTLAQGAELLVLLWFVSLGCILRGCSGREKRGTRFLRA
jgi:hypothetical protein